MYLINIYIYIYIFQEQRLIKQQKEITKVYNTVHTDK